MAGFVDVFRKMRGWLSGVANQPPDAPGIEYTLRPNRMQYTIPGQPEQFTIRANRMHFTVQEED